MPCSSALQKDFVTHGYVLLPAALPASYNDAMKRDIDALVEDRKNKHAKHVVEYETLGQLCAYPPIVDKVHQLMAAYGNQRTDMALHHIHAARHDTGTGSSNWHQASRPSACRRDCCCWPAQRGRGYS